MVIPEPWLFRHDENFRSDSSYWYLLFCRLSMWNISLPCSPNSNIRAKATLTHCLYVSVMSMCRAASSLTMRTASLRVSDRAYATSSAETQSTVSAETQSTVSVPSSIGWLTFEPSSPLSTELPIGLTELTSWLTSWLTGLLLSPFFKSSYLFKSNKFNLLIISYIIFITFNNFFSTIIYLDSHKNKSHPSYSPIVRQPFKKVQARPLMVASTLM